MLMWLMNMGFAGGDGGVVDTPSRDLYRRGRRR